MANINQIGTIIYLKLIPTGFITGDQNFHLILIISNKYVEFDRHKQTPSFRINDKPNPILSI